LSKKKAATGEPNINHMPTPNAAASVEPFRADWRDPSKYPPPGCEDMDRLAWEFLRRNPLYAVHVQQMLELPEGEFVNGLTKKGGACLDGQVCWPPATKGETVSEYWKRHADRKKKGLKARISKPARTFKNRWSLDAPVLVSHKYDTEKVIFSRFKPVPSVVKGLKGANARLPLFPNEIAFRFRLDLSVDKQAAALEPVLRREVKKYAEQLRSVSDQRGNEKSLSSKRKSDDIHNAHYWLRAYDAHMAKSGTQLHPADPTLRRKQKDGPTEIRKLFEDEIAEATKSCSMSAYAGQLTLNRNSVNDFRSRATEHIHEMKYLLLLDHFIVEPKAKVARREFANAAKHINTIIRPG
jgi:hypothetical protein